MTKPEALKMVRDAQSHVETFGRSFRKAERESLNDLQASERSLEFEVAFEGRQ